MAVGFGSVKSVWCRCLQGVRVRPQSEASVSHCVELVLPTVVQVRKTARVQFLELTLL